MSEPLSSRTDSKVINDDTNLEPYLPAALIIPDTEIVRLWLKTRKTGKRSGAPNYTEEDIDTLLDIMEIKEPVGARDWTAVTTEHNNSAEKSGYYKRDLE